jgi:hypothetical protein
MTPISFLLITLIIVLPIAWLVSEFFDNRTIRIILGLVAMGGTTLSVGAVYALFTIIDYNVYYGSTTGDLVSTSVEQIDKGNQDRVLEAWRALDRDYQPTYENRAQYRELVEGAIRWMRGEKAEGAASGEANHESERPSEDE